MWLVIGLTAIVLINLFGGGVQRQQSILMTYSQFWANVKNGTINSVIIQDDKILGSTSDGRPFMTVTPEDGELIPLLRQANINIEVKEAEKESL